MKENLLPSFCLHSLNLSHHIHVIFSTHQLHPRDRIQMDVYGFSLDVASVQYTNSRWNNFTEIMLLSKCILLSIVWLVCRRTAWLQHLLHQIEADPRLALVLSDGEVVEQIKVSHVGAVGVPVLVHQPLPLAGVCVTRPDVLGLQMLQLTVDVVAVGHCHFLRCSTVLKTIE